MARDRLSDFNMVDFESSEDHFLFNPRLGPGELKWLKAASFPTLAGSGHIWLASSGTTATGTLKVLALSKRAFLVAAAAANRHLKSTAKDVWLNPLPLFHVGGLSVHARAFLSGARVISPPSPKWNVTEFVSTCENENVTLASVVPTQVYDLVHSAWRAPSSLRAILVGGGALSSELYSRARELGWPLLPTYGMTEVCSQVATASLGSLRSLVVKGLPAAEVLGHLEARVNSEGRLQLRGESLFSAIGYVNESGYKSAQEYADVSSITDGWYTTNDYCEVANADAGSRHLRFVGRADDLVKVGGELVNLAKLAERFAAAYPAMSCIFLSEPDLRLGDRVVMACDVSAALNCSAAIAAFNTTVAPFERIRALYALRELPRTPLGKIKSGEIKAIIS